ncbi:MAG: hypothetical protein Q9163_005990 [Psora crenata]
MGFEPEAAIYDDSWMEFVNEDLMIDASDPSQSRPSSPSGKIEDASLRSTVSQTVADTCNPAPSPHTANPMSPIRSTSSGPCERCRESEAHQKRGRSEYNILEAVVQGLPRSDLLDCLETHWQALMTEGIYVARNKLVGCNIILSSVTWILRTTYTYGDDRSRTEETWMGTTPSSPKLRPINGLEDTHGGVGRQAVVKHIWNTSLISTWIELRRITSVRNKAFRRTCGTGDDATLIGRLSSRISTAHTQTLTMCEVMRSAAESLVYDSKLRDDVDFNAIALGLKQDI